MGLEVWTVVRHGTSPQTSSANRPMASRRGGGPDRRQTIMAVASSRRRGRGSRSPCATPPRCKGAATKLMRKLLRKQGFAPETLVTDRVCSYASAKTQLGLSARHEQGLRKKELQLAQQGGRNEGRCVDRWRARPRSTPRREPGCRSTIQRLALGTRPPGPCGAWVSTTAWAAR